MTREEAIQRLYGMGRSHVGIIDENALSDNKALSMAIEALEVLESPTGYMATYTEDRERSDLISRQDALKPFCVAPDGTRIPEVDCDNFPVEFSVEFIKKHLLSLPSAEQKKGHWIDEETNYLCSECHRGCWVNSDYCPWCGSRMVREDGEE